MRRGRLANDADDATENIAGSVRTQEFEVGCRMQCFKISRLVLTVVGNRG